VNQDNCLLASVCGANDRSPFGDSQGSLSEWQADVIADFFDEAYEYRLSQLHLMKRLTSDLLLVGVFQPALSSLLLVRRFVRAKETR